MSDPYLDHDALRRLAQDRGEARAANLYPRGSKQFEESCHREADKEFLALIGALHPKPVEPMTDSERAAIRAAAFKEAAEIARAHSKRHAYNWGLEDDGPRKLRDKAREIATWRVAEAIEALAAAKGGQK